SANGSSQTYLLMKSDCGITLASINQCGFHGLISSRHASTMIGWVFML
ncbi:unnamed protein product, partial [Brassica oleracea var. botrytis]